MLELAPRCAFDGLLHDSGPRPAGVWAQPLAGLGLANVIARKGAAAETARRIRRLLGVAPPAGPSHAALGASALVGTAPGAWLAISYGGPWPVEWTRALEEVAAVVDQSCGQGVIRLGGPAVAEVLARGVFLDLHPSAFPPGAAAATNLAHVGVLLWRVQPDVFELAVPRSYAPTLAHWLGVSAAEAGLRIVPAAEPAPQS